MRRFRARLFRTLKEADVPTIPEHLVALTLEYFARPDVAERWKPVEDAWAKTFRGFFDKADAALKRVADSPPSEGYEPWLISRGHNPILARMMANLIVHHGKRTAEENERLPTAVDAIRFLAGPRRTKAAIARKAAILLAAWHETSALDTVFKGTCLDVFEFIRILTSAADEDQRAYPRLMEVTSSLARNLAIPRGPKLSAASAAHEFFLANIVSTDSARAYSWNNLEETFTDPVTAATRREFKAPDFDPRPAYRRLKAHQKRN